MAHPALREPVLSRPGLNQKFWTGNFRLQLPDSWVCLLSKPQAAQSSETQVLRSYVARNNAFGGSSTKLNLAWGLIYGNLPQNIQKRGSGEKAQRLMCLLDKHEGLRLDPQSLLLGLPRLGAHWPARRKMVSSGSVRLCLRKTVIVPSGFHTHVHKRVHLCTHKHISHLPTHPARVEEIRAREHRVGNGWLGSTGRELQCIPKTLVCSSVVYSHMLDSGGNSPVLAGYGEPHLEWKNLRGWGRGLSLAQVQWRWIYSYIFM